MVERYDIQTIDSPVLFVALGIMAAPFDLFASLWLNRIIDNQEAVFAASLQWLHFFRQRICT